MERYWIENGILVPNERGGLVKYADTQATVEALRAIIKQMGEQACVLAKDGMAAKAQVEALQLERNEAIEAASLPTWVCDGCGRVSSDGWINHVIESLDGTDYEMECPTCGARDIEEDCALDLVRERDDLQAALDAEREKAEVYRKALSLISVKTTPWFEGHHGTVEDILAAYAAYVLKQRTLPATTPAKEEMGCQICKGAKGVPGNEQIINGIVVCDYCHVAYIREEGGDGE